MATGLELATAYVSLAVSTKDMGRQVVRELGGIEREAEKSGGKVGSKLGEGFKTAAKAGALAFAAVGAAAGAALMEALDVGAANAKLSAQLGLTGEAAAKAGKMAGDLYAANYGESIGDVNEAIKLVSQNVSGAGAIGSDSMKALTADVLSVSSAFDQDLAGSTAAVGQLIKTGLAKDGKEALDIITVGMQKGVNKADDLLDTFTEYSTVFRDIGISGKDATGLLSQGLAAGARDADTVADALKELAIRGQDGSTTSAAGFKAVGLSAEKMTAAFAKGGPAAREATDQVLDGLRKITDPAKRNAAAVQLFGTKAEDLGDALFALDLDTAATGLGKVDGAAKGVNDTLSNTPAAKIEGFKRTVTQTFVNLMGGVVLPKLMAFGDWVGSKLGPIFDTLHTGFDAFFAALEEGDVTSDGFVGVMETIGDFLHRVLPPAIATAQAAFTAIKDFIVREVVPRFMSIATAIQNFVAVATPIVTGFVSGMIARIQPLMPTIRTIFATIGQIITGALDAIKAVIERVTSVIGWIWSNWGTGIMNFIADIWAKILNIVQPALDAIRGIFSVFTSVFKGDWGAAWESLKGVFSSAWKVVTGTIDLALTVLGRALSVAWEGIVSAAGAIWEKLTDAIAGPIDRVMQFIQENFIDKINGLFEFLHIPIHLSPIWKQSNVGTGMVNAGRRTTQRRLGFAEGGYTGPGSKWQPAGIVHAGEVVWSQRDVKRAGGVGVVERMRLGQYANGGFVKPVNANPGFPYGRYPSGKIHRALDFPVPVGTPVRAPYGGTVLYAGWDSTGYGNVVRTHDADGAYSILGHNSRLMVKTGQSINAGQLVAYSGNTGNSTGPHLHWARRTRPYDDASAFNPFGGGTGTVLSDLIKSGIESIASGARGFAGAVGGPFGPLFAGIVDRLVKGVGARALSMLGVEGGELRPRLYDQGGMIAPGDTLVRNKTGRPETLLPFDIRDGGLSLSRDQIDLLAAALGSAVRAGAAQGIGFQAAEVAYGRRY